MVVLDKNEFESVEEKEVTVASALEETVSGGRLGSLRLDPQSLTMGKTFTYSFKTFFFKLKEFHVILPFKRDSQHYSLSNQ